MLFAIHCLDHDDRLRRHANDPFRHADVWRDLDVNPPLMRADNRALPIKESRPT